MKQRGIFFFLPILIFFVYSNTLWSSFHFDDISSIVQNYAIKDIFNLKAIWNFWPTRFITYFSFAWNYHFHQLDVFGYHLLNIIIHILSSFFVWLLALLACQLERVQDNGSKLFKDYRYPIAFFASAVFALHPIQTQAVTYITQRAVSLCGLFCLASVFFYLRFRFLRLTGANWFPTRISYFLSLLCGVFAMFTKEIAIILPIGIALCDKLFVRQKTEKNTYLFLPFVLLFFIIPVTFSLTRSLDYSALKRISEGVELLSPWEYFFTELRVIITYLRLSFLPVVQNLLYDYPVQKDLFSVSVLSGIVLVIASILFALKFIRNYRLMSFGIFWFFLMLLPESSFIPIQDLIFEHRLYLALFGYALFFVSGIFYLTSSRRIFLGKLFLFAVVLSYALLAYNRNAIWQNEITLWSDVIARSPRNTAGYTNRGIAFFRLGSFQEALADFGRTLEIDPKNVQAFVNRGVIYFYIGRQDLALKDFNRAIRYLPFISGDETKSDAYTKRGVVYFSQGNYGKALKDFNRALDIYFANAEALFNRGSLFARSAEYKKAIGDFTIALRLNPDYAQAYYNRGYAYYLSREYAAAYSDFRKAADFGILVDKSMMDEIGKYGQIGK